ncbi:MAG: SLC13 family permease [Actinomycetota bacterium]|nr:SLC13 family permease [Actinomycetota bacterium]
MSALRQAIDQSWPPFVLVAGLLLVGAVAASDGLFEAAGSRLARLPGGGPVLFGTLMALTCGVTVVLNLDTAVVFLTPVVLHAARRRQMGETALLYGTVFLVNASSLLLPGSNLTNLIVQGSRPVSGAAFAARMAPAWGAAVVVTVAVVAWWWRADLRTPEPGPIEVTRWRLGTGAVGVVGATFAVLVPSRPAVPALVVGIACVAAQRALRRLPLRVAWRAVNPPLLAGLFVVAAAVGALGREVGSLGHLTSTTGPWTTAWIGVAAACLVNNLPAAALLSSHAVAHGRALLIGLDLGPNLAVSGSLSAVLWLRVARAEGAAVSIRRYSAIGAVIVPLSVSAAIAAGGLR